MTTARRSAYLLLALAALGAGVIHLVSVHQHMEQWRPLGIAFLIAGVLQITWAGLMAAGGSRLLLQVGAWGSLLFAGVYVMSLTTGLPVGPQAFEREAFGTAGLLCTALEVPIAIGCLVLARKANVLRRPLTTRLAVVLAGAVVMVGSATSVAVASSPHAHHEVCASAPVLTGVLDARGVDTGVTAYFRCKLKAAHRH